MSQSLSTRTSQGLTPSQDYDSEFCGRIPVQYINSTQAYGFLLVLSVDTLSVLQVSDTSRHLGGRKPTELLERRLEELLPSHQYDVIRDKVKAGLPPRFTTPLSLQLDDTELRFMVQWHTTNQYLLTEWVPTSLTRASASQGFPSLQQEAQTLQQAETFEALAQETVEMVRTLAGFDKVMLYQFDPKWNGVVIAETKAEGMASYLGLRFPASDVPRQSRELYRTNPYRFIPDRTYTPARLLPLLNPITQSFTDLSQCNLRGVAPVHIEYLGNMGVTASLSLPIRVNEKLWGLISCHHRTALQPDADLLSSLEVASTLVALRISALEKETHLQQQLSQHQHRVLMLERFYNGDSLESCLFEQSPNVLELLGLSGASLVVRNEIVNQGTTPSVQQIKALVTWLRRYHPKASFFSQSLAQEDEIGEGMYEVASGLVALPLLSSSEAYFLGYRAELVQSIDWGGNPNEAINFEANSKAYHPRHSFELWKETVRFTSTPWQDEERQLAMQLQVMMQQKIQGQ
ncbi:PAS fold-containing protein [Catalinimonas alkaloidigena]|uniref:PAS fold-containing protein n=1 Tax=Catalinimonas alkaloidigena TaxID=1075417 RepID=A0A1G9T0D5_9BACT|nr:GAF domain-containing protein [Catalinimonas alkaloidigena]SDM41087.1 PAS fold-containing protein [Catalinimonas alkaloidigena]